MALVAPWLLLVLLALAPGARAQDELRSDLPRAQPALDRSALDRRARGTLDLGLSLLRAVPQGNAVLSPHALSQALGLVLAGVEGEAAVELRRALRITGTTEDGLAALNALDQALTSRVGQGRSGAFKVRSVQALWVRRDAPPSGAYLDALATHFGAGARLVDLAGDAAGARAAIHRWATDALGEEVDDLVRAGEVTGDAGLVAVSAAALNAAWQTPFEITQSTQGRFTSEGAGSLVVPTMSASGLMRSVVYEGVRAVEVPFARDELSLLVLVPVEGELSALERSLTADRLAGIMGTMGQQPAPTHLVMPRFAVRTRLDLRNGLRAVGVRAGPLAVFVHEARADVNEAGAGGQTGAAGVLMPACYHAPQQQAVGVGIDRPFLFLVRDRFTGATLLLGRVVDPR
jgi:serpin B